MFGIINMRQVDAEEMIDKLPAVDELTVRELAIHLRAETIGHQKGVRYAKLDILHRFQMTMFGHVL